MFYKINHNPLKTEYFMKINQWLSIAALSVSALFSTSTLAEEPVKVGFIYVGSIGDHGWSYEHDQARQEMEKYFDGKVKTTYVENVAEGADAERVITQLAKAGNEIIFTTSFGFMNPTLKVAKRFPKVVFEHATGFKRSKNMGTYALRTYEGRYVSGVAAGLTTKTNTIGYIASFPIPEVIRDINAAYLGAKSVNPNVKMKIVWVNTWYDPGKETDAANALMDQGVDVLLQHTDSPAPVIAAEKRGIYAIGQASDMSHFAPKAHLFSVRDHWAPFYIKTVQSVMDGTWKSTDYWNGFKDDVLQIVSVNPALPETIKKAITEAHDKIKSGEIIPFAGPLKDNQGNEKVAAGAQATDQELMGINWYVEGIDATIPK
jgi:basic membrane protein A and related proteins